jgi:hypothetical protein
MKQIIPHRSTSINNYFSSSAISPPKIHFIPKRCYELLRILREDYDANGLNRGVSQRGRHWYCLRFKVSWKSIQNDFAYLKQLGFCVSSPGGRGNSEKRCITSAGYSYLDCQPSTYTSTYNPITPYIDLSEKEKINSKIIKDEQFCGQVEEETRPIEEILDDPMIDSETKLDYYFEKERMPSDERAQIKNIIRKSRIGPVRKERIVERLIHQSKKRWIASKRNYILACIHNEEIEMKALFNAFRGKNLSVNLYAQL